MKRFALLLFSTGWLLPAYVAIRLFYYYLSTDVQEFIWTGKAIALPVSYLELSFDAMKIAFAWFSIAVVFWTWRLIRKEAPTIKKETK